MRLKDKKVVITGAGRGIGKAIALAYAEEGADLVVTSRSVESLDDVVKEIQTLGRKAFPMEWDVSDVSLAGEKIERARSVLGGFDILVNNAGVLKNDGSAFPDLTSEEWDYVMGVNLKGLYFVCQAAVRDMRRAGSGTIINIASDIGIRGTTAPYGLSKWGVVGLTKGMGKTLAPDIRVNAIAPGPVATRMMGWEQGKPISYGTPLGRMTLPEEVAAAAVYLASDAAASVVGEILVIDGGNSL